MNGTKGLTENSVLISNPDELPHTHEAKDHIYSEHVHGKRQSPHAHVHSEESLRGIINRLSRIEGHIRGIKRMVEESSPCPEVLIQIAAVRGALDRVARIILDEHLTECIARATQEGNIEVEIEALKAALDQFMPGKPKAVKMRNPDE